MVIRPLTHQTALLPHKEQLAVLDTYDEIFESIANSAKTQAGGSPTSRSGAL